MICIFIHTIYYFYSVRNASTGSFLLASLLGITPAINVSTTLITTKNIAPPSGSDATLIPTISFSIIFAKTFSINVITIPKVPDTKPIIMVSALNTLDTSFLDAPIALSIPISFVLSNTEI